MQVLRLSIRRNKAVPAEWSEADRLYLTVGMLCCVWFKVPDQATSIQTNILPFEPVLSQRTRL